MPSAARNDATGEPITFTYDGDTYTVPPALQWDLDVMEAYEAEKVATLVRLLLGTEQWATFRSRKRTVGDLQDLFMALQEAAGVSGKLTQLAALLRDHADALEADLTRYYGVDLGGLWRGELSLRRLSVLVAHLPAGSATWAAQTGVPYGWTLTDLLITDLYHALTGQPHPARPAVAAAGASRAAHLRARLHAQRARLQTTDHPKG